MERGVDGTKVGERALEMDGWMDEYNKRKIFIKTLLISLNL